MSKKVVIQGLGPIGRGVAGLVTQDPDIELVSAIDPVYTGKSLAKLLGYGRQIIVSESPDRVLSEMQADTLVLATSSTIERTLNDIERAVNHGVNVITPAEEWFFPEYVNQGAADYINDLSVKNAVSVIGRGVNPGLLMDLYPARLIKNYDINDVDLVEIFRWDNTLNRRRPLLEKTGVGCRDEKEFFEKEARGLTGHVGSEMSAAYVADRAGFGEYEMGFSRGPVIAEETLKPDNADEIRPGEVSGLSERASVIVDGGERIILNLRMSADAPKKNCTRIYLRDGGMHEADYSSIPNGDIMTQLVVHDLIGKVDHAGPGLNNLDYVPDPNELS